MLEYYTIHKRKTEFNKEYCNCYLEAFKPKCVNWNYIWYGVNSLWLESLHFLLDSRTRLDLLLCIVKTSFYKLYEIHQVKNICTHVMNCMEASEPKWVNPNDIQSGVNSLRLGGFHIIKNGLNVNWRPRALVS